MSHIVIIRIERKINNSIIDIFFILILLVKVSNLIKTGKLKWDQQQIEFE